MMDDVFADGEAALWAIGARDAAPRPMSPAFIAEVASLREAVALIALGLDAVTPDARVWPALERALALTMTTFRVVGGPGGRRWLVITLDLPGVAGHDYQLWFVPESGPPVSAGLLRPDRRGVRDTVTAVPESLGPVRPAISLEPSGGSPAPTDVKLVGETI